MEPVLDSLSEESPLDFLEDFNLLKAFLTSFCTNTFSFLAFCFLLFAAFLILQSTVLWVQQGPLFFLQRAQNFLAYDTKGMDGLISCRNIVCLDIQQFLYIIALSNFLDPGNTKIIVLCLQILYVLLDLFLKALSNGCINTMPYFRCSWNIMIIKNV